MQTKRVLYSAFELVDEILPCDNIKLSSSSFMWYWLSLIMLHKVAVSFELGMKSFSVTVQKKLLNSVLILLCFCQQFEHDTWPLFSYSRVSYSVLCSGHGKIIGVAILNVHTIKHTITDSYNKTFVWQNLTGDDFQHLYLSVEDNSLFVL